MVQGKNDYGDGGIFFGFFIVPKAKYSPIFDEYGILEERKTFKGFEDAKRSLGRKQNFDFSESKIIVEFFQYVGKEVLMEVLRFLQKLEILKFVSSQKLKHLKNLKR